MFNCAVRDGPAYKLIEEKVSYQVKPGSTSKHVHYIDVYILEIKRIINHLFC